MENNGFAADFLQILLGWLQRLFNGIWALFSGGSGGSVLKWFSNNWITLLLALIIFGIVTDILVYLIRWRPFWWWFRKKRLVIDDELYDDYLGAKVSKTGDGKYVVPSTIVTRKKRNMEEDEFDDEDVFSVKKKHDDPFEVDYSASHKRSSNAKSAPARRKIKR